MDMELEQYLRLLELLLNAYPARVITLAVVERLMQSGKSGRSSTLHIL